MITPTIGRVVWYWPTSPNPVDQPFAMLITYVHNDRLVNLGGWDSNGIPISRTSVQLLQGVDLPRGPCAQWMPYQLGQAAKTEALEKEKTA